MKETIDFNLNGYIWIQLTDDGRKALEQQYKKLGLRAYTPKEEDEDGWSKWQMHDLMNHFGEMMYPRLDPPFKPNIRIETEKETEDENC